MARQRPDPNTHITTIVWFFRADAVLIETSTPPRRRIKLPVWAHHWVRRNGQVNVSQFIPPKEIRIVMSSITVHDNQPDFEARAVFQDATGATTLPDDIPSWASSDETIIGLVPSLDGTSAIVKVAGGVGTATVTCSSTDNDGTKIVLEGDITVTAGEAVRGDIVFTLPDGSVTSTSVSAPVAVTSADSGTTADSAPSA